MSNDDNSPFEGGEPTSFEDFEASPEPSAPLPARRRDNKNRGFWIVLGVLAGLFILALIVLGVLSAIILPSRNAARLEEAAQINAQNTATSVAATNNAVLATELKRPTETLPPTATVQSSSTPLLVMASDTAEPEDTGTPEEGIGAAPEDMAARTATLSYLLTQAARTATATFLPGTVTGTVTALPETGFADQFGLPLLGGLALLLVVVIFFVRKLRSANNG